MNPQGVDAEDIITSYRAAVEHANGRLFASELHVSHADGWFTVRDLDGTESRYRQKEMVSLTRQLLKQPEYKPESFADIVEEVAATRPPAPPAPVRHVPPPPKTAAVEPALVMLGSGFQPLEAGTINPPLNRSIAATPSALEQGSASTSEKVVQFPGVAAQPTKSSERVHEERGYKRNLWRIFLIVGAVFAAIIVFLLLRGR
jgi:hypothetical protein